LKYQTYVEEEQTTRWTKKKAIKRTIVTDKKAVPLL